MLSPDYILRISEGAEEIASQLHEDIVNRIVERVVIRMERGDSYRLTAIDKWQIETLKDTGVLEKDIMKEIAKRTKLQRTEIKEAFEDAGVKSSGYEDEIYEAAGLSPTPILESPQYVRMLQRNYEKTLGEFENFTGSLAKEAQQAFIRECDTAYTLVSSGTTSLSQAVREAVNRLADDGIRVHYPSGRSDSIETATLRAVRTGVSQACAEVTDARMEEMDWDIILVSSHLGARYTGANDFTNHMWWQGKFYSKSGKNKRFPPFSVCGYGNVQGICGANCRHSYGPGDGEHNPYDKFDDEENKRSYDLSQEQRAQERKIREGKRKAMAIKSGRDAATSKELRDALDLDYQKTAAKLQEQNKAYKEFCEKNDLKPLQDRLMVAKWDREQAKEAHQAANQHHKAWLKSIGAEGTSLKTLDKYLNAKYNNTDEYGLLTGYSKAVKKHDISPLVGFEQYLATAAAIEDKLVGQVTANGIKIESFATHFIDRVIGQVSEPHPHMRLGFLVSDGLDAIINPIEIGDLEYIRGDIRRTFYGKKAQVTISERDNRLIQGNPLSWGKE